MQVPTRNGGVSISFWHATAVAIAVIRQLGGDFDSFWKDDMGDNCRARHVLNFMIEMCSFVTLLTLTTMDWIY